MPVTKTAVKTTAKKTKQIASKVKPIVPRAATKPKSSPAKLNLSPAKSVTRSVKSKTNAKPKADQSTEAVTILTGLPSLRLKEKVRLYRQWYDTVLPGIMAKSSIVAGYIFILLGAGFVTNLALTHHDSWRLQVATLICNYNTCDTNIPQPEPVAPVAQPQIEFTAIPDTLLAGDTFIVTIRNASSHLVSLISFDTAETIELDNFTRLEAGQYRYSISNIILPGRYRLSARLTDISGQVQQQYVAPRQIRVLPPVPVITNTTASEPVSVVSVGFGSVPPPAEVVNSIQSPANSSSTPSEIQSEPEITLESAPIVPVSTFPFLRLSLASGDQQTGLYRLSIVADKEDYRTIEVYAQATNSNTPLFLGIATKLRAGWVYWFNTENLPVGNYQLYAVSNNRTDTLRSTSISIVKSRSLLTTGTANIISDSSTSSTAVANNNLNSPTQTSRDVVIGFKTQETPGLEETIEVASTNNLSTTSRGTGQISLPAEVSTLLRSANNDLQSALTNYAAADATDDEGLRRLAQAELDNYASKLASEFVLNSTAQISTTEIKAFINQEIYRVAQNSRIFKELTRDRGHDNFLDSDSDGISDTDEIYLYETDPFNPDSDGDGFLDGIEIMRGFNPQDPQGEVIIDYESPRDFSYVNDEKLKITEVIPLIDFDEEFNPTTVRAVISGKALPNSFVTLYIFSTPTVVTVRTDASGSFEYIFSKELEDGAHEVYVALTDNSGNIVARSNGFAFVKTAQAFTYADAESGSAVVSVTPNLSGQLTVSYYLVAAMGVIAFGLILLLLGRSLGGRREDTVFTKAGYDTAN